MDFKFGVLLAISAYICTTHALPPCVCTRNYTPVCGSDGETYSNMCLLECAQFQHKPVTFVKEGPCADTSASNCICTLNYLPVCGSDGVTYPNKCSFECQKARVAGLELTHNGECVPQPTVPQPPCVCTREKKPVCGSDGRTYSNDCLLNCATAKDNTLSIANYGPCEDKVKVAELHA